MVSVEVKVPVADNEKPYPVKGPTVISPAVKFVPFKENELDDEFVFRHTEPKELNVPALNEGVAATPHKKTALVLFLGEGAQMVKSALLLFASVQPLLLRNAAVVVLKAAVAVPSNSFAVP